MRKKIFGLICMIWLGFSCGSMNSMMQADSRIKKVQIGMTMKEVSKMMGEYHEVVKANRDFTVWGYKTAEGDVYEMIFEEGRLSEFTKIRLPKPIEVRQDKEHVHIDSK